MWSKIGIFLVGIEIAVFADMKIRSSRSKYPSPSSMSTESIVAERLPVIPVTSSFDYLRLLAQSALRSSEIAHYSSCMGISMETRV